MSVFQLIMKVQRKFSDRIRNEFIRMLRGVDRAKLGLDLINKLVEPFSSLFPECKKFANVKIRGCLDG